MNQGLLSQVLQVGAGAAFILFPLIFVFAFAVHPGLLRPRLLKPAEIIRRARRNQVPEGQFSAMMPGLLAIFSKLPS